MFQVGDIVGFLSRVAGKHKYHLCVSEEGHYLFLNTPRAKAGEFLTPCSNVPGVPATDSGMSAISMTLVMTKSDQDLTTLGAQKCGKMPVAALKALLKAVQASPLLTAEQKDPIVEGLLDHLGF